MESALILIERGADLSSNNWAHTSPLHDASLSGNKGLLTLLLERTPKDDINVESKQMGTPLYAASFRGNLEAVILLLKAGADTSLGKDRQSPIEAAKEGGHIEVVRLLQEHQELKERNNKTPAL
jgi:ankyrin repeat protein